MQDLKPDFSITSHEKTGEIHFTACGYWTSETAKTFEAQMARTLGPIVASGRKLRFLADLRGLVPTDRTVAAQIERLIEHSLQLGNEKTALIADSKLTEIQHRRLNSTTNLKTFQDKVAALAWLRA